MLSLENNYILFLPFKAAFSQNLLSILGSTIIISGGINMIVFKENIHFDNKQDIYTSSENHEGTDYGSIWIC